MEKFSSTSKRGIEPRRIGDKFDREKERLFSRIPRSKKGVEAKEGAKLEQKARRGETRQVSKRARKQSKEGGKREARERWRRRAVEGKEQHWLVCYQQQVPVKQTFNVSGKPSLSPSRADLPPFFLSFSFPLSLSPSPRTRFLLIDSSTRIGAQERSRRFASIQ